MRRVVELLLIVTVLLGMGTACARPTLTEQFIRAIEDAAVPEPDEVAHDLTPIGDRTPDLRWRDPAIKQRLLVASVMSEDVFRKYYGPRGSEGGLDRNARPVWVTLVPELEQACRSWGLTEEALNLRLSQYLGLAPDRKNDRVVLLWIGRDRLLRPCPDPEPDDRNCTREPTTSKLEIGAGRSYRDYFLGLFESSYRVEGAPWTRLGYTYDWNSKSPERGASEFIALPGTSWEVEAVATPDEYCRAER